MPRGLRGSSKIVNDALTTQDRRRPKHRDAFDVGGSIILGMLRWWSYLGLFILLAHLFGTAKDTPLRGGGPSGRRQCGRQYWYGEDATGYSD